ncbi:MAG: hypothetical protein M0C28_04510 [Candidatus Moduliflexus flocculans]|nr:hypothetical protein [Candidatus Moduliflexus flocculans]
MAVADLAARIRAVPGEERHARVAAVLNSFMTCEELALARRIFTEALGLDGIFVADPPPGSADGFLLTAERVPNARGVLDAGFAPRLPDLDALARSTGVLIVFGPYLAGNFPAGTAAQALSSIPAKYLFTSRAVPEDLPADVAVPVSVTAERSGTYINVDGLRQTFRPAVAPPRGVPSEREVLVRLARGLGLNVGGPDAD